MTAYFPILKSSRLKTLINQSLYWQHRLCKNPRPTQISKFYLQTIHAHLQMVLSTFYLQPFPPNAASANANAMAGWMANVAAAATSSVQASVVSALSLANPPNQG
ncbi:topless-related protein 3 [Tanacetum coccineum]